MNHGNVFENSCGEHETEIRPVLKPSSPVFPTGSYSYSMFSSTSENPEVCGGLSSRNNVNGEKFKAAKSQECNHAPSVLIRIATVGVSSLWVGPLVVLFWCITWSCIERVVFPDNLKLSAWTCVVFGYSIHFLATCLQAKLSNILSVWTSSSVRCLLTSLYIYIVAFAAVSQWKGLWTLLDIYLEAGLTQALVTGAGAVIVLLLARGCLSVAGVPCEVTPDLPHHSSCFSVPTYFTVNRNSPLIVLDSLFTVSVIASLVICVWRATFNVLDLLLFPDDKTKSSLYTLALSYGLFLALSLLQTWLSRLSAYLDSIHWLYKLILEDFVYIVQSFVSITHWRGFWVLLLEYYPLTPMCLTAAHLVSFVALTFTMASRNLMVIGCARDGAMRDGQGMQPNVSYLTEFFRYYRPKTRVENIE